MTRASEILHHAAGTQMYEHPAACHVSECTNNTLSSLETEFSCALVVDADQPNCGIPGITPIDASAQPTEIHPPEIPLDSGTPINEVKPSVASLLARAAGGITAYGMPESCARNRCNRGYVNGVDVGVQCFVEWYDCYPDGGGGSGDTPGDDGGSTGGGGVHVPLPFDCAAHHRAKPATCPATNRVPNATPIFPSGTASGIPAWRDNGCGSAEWQQMIGDALGAGLFGGSFGDHNAPYAEVSFHPACAAHDWCWGSGGSKTDCDRAFYEVMQNSPDSSGKQCYRIPTCATFAVGYFRMVDRLGASAYEAAQTDIACARWWDTLMKNRCPLQP